MLHFFVNHIMMIDGGFDLYRRKAHIFHFKVLSAEGRVLKLLVEMEFQVEIHGTSTQFSRKHHEEGRLYHLG